MNRAILLAVLSLLSACSDPGFGLGIRIGPDGTTVTPSASGNLGGAHVTVSG